MNIDLFKKNWQIILLLLSLPLTIWPLFLPGYFSHHDDLQVMRIFEMKKCLEDLQIPCRWVPDMGYGNGFPLFNYYGPSIYYLGGLVSFILSYIWSAKLLFLIPLLAGPFFIYLLTRELFGKDGAFVSTILFMFAPYRALDTFVRGALDESFAIALMPALLYFSFKFSRSMKFYDFLLLTCTLGIFLITHNIMSIIFLPVFFLWSGYLLLQAKSRVLVYLLTSIVLSFGLASFFLLPAYFEKSLVRVETLTTFDLNFRAHFVTFPQIFLKRDWGYGASVPGPNDTISFQIGWPHWWLVVAATLVSVWQVYRGRRKRSVFGIIWLAVFLVSVFMMHNKSAFIWEKLPILQYAQFPWRFLSLTILSTAILGGYLLSEMKFTKSKLILTTVAFLAVFLNWQFFRPEKFYYQLTDQEKLFGKLWDEQRKAGILDYLPKTAPEPKEGAPEQPILVSGRAKIVSFINRSNYWELSTEVSKEARLEIPVFYFPNWQTFVSSQSFPSDHNNFMNRLSIDLPPGRYLVVGRFLNTQIRTIANSITAISFLILISMIVYVKANKRAK